MRWRKGSTMARIVIPKPRFVSTDLSQTSESESSYNENDTAVLAYYLWQARGCPDGSAEADWYQAEEKQRQGMKASGINVRSANA